MILSTGTDIMPHLIIDLTAQIVSAHVSNNEIPADELPTLIRVVHQALTTISQTGIEPPKAEPAVLALKSVFADHIVCMDCGKGFKTLKRHIRTDHALTPDQYRAKWRLPFSYPMSAPGYAAERSQIAKDSGLGRKAAAPVPQKRGRPARAW
jgi:predicted transcriptional regulator